MINSISKTNSNYPQPTLMFGLWCQMWLQPVKNIDLQLKGNWYYSKGLINGRQKMFRTTKLISALSTRFSHFRQVFKHLLLRFFFRFYTHRLFRLCRVLFFSLTCCPSLEFPSSSKMLCIKCFLSTLDFGCVFHTGTLFWVFADRLHLLVQYFCFKNILVSWNYPVYVQLC